VTPRPSGRSASDRPLSNAEIHRRLARLPGWHLTPSGAAIVRNFTFLEWAGAVLFVNYFGAVVRISPLDVDFLLNSAGSMVGVALGARSFPGITPGTFVLAGIADDLARLNLGEV
jgi:hypothetical protein